MSNELVSTLALMPETKNQQDLFVGKLIDSVKGGVISPLKAGYYRQPRTSIKGVQSK